VEASKRAVMDDFEPGVESCSAVLIRNSLHGGLGYRNEIRARRLPETRKIIRAKPILEIRRANPDIAVGTTIDDSIRDPSRPRIWIGPDEAR
jgi:hypothetical protein